MFNSAFLFFNPFNLLILIPAAIFYFMVAISFSILIYINFKIDKSINYFKFSFFGFGFLKIKKDTALFKNYNLIKKTKNKSLFFIKPRFLSKR